MWDHGPGRAPGPTTWTVERQERGSPGASGGDGPRISPKGRMGDAVRILIADDHPLTRDGIKAALAMDPGLKVIAEAADGQEAVSLAASERPDVVLMDVRMPRLGGIRATQEIMRIVPE